MRIMFGALTAILMICGTAMAAQIEGHIKAINKEESTITLDNGKAYKLPGEFDVDTLKEGMDVVLAYDQVEGVSQITDMDISE